MQHAMETPYTTWRIRFTCSGPRQQTRISVTLRSCLFALTVSSLRTWIFSQNYLNRIGIINRFMFSFWQGSVTFFLYRNSSYFKWHICYAATDNPISCMFSEWHSQFNNISRAFFWHIKLTMCSVPENKFTSYHGNTQKWKCHHAENG